MYPIKAITLRINGMRHIQKVKKCNKWKAFIECLLQANLYVKSTACGF